MTAPSFQITVHADDIELIEQLWKQLRRPDQHVPGSIDIDAGVVRLEVDLRGAEPATDPLERIRQNLAMSADEAAELHRRAVEQFRANVESGSVRAPDRPFTWTIQHAEVAPADSGIEPEIDDRSDFERGTFEDLRAAGLDQPAARVEPAMVLDSLCFMLYPEDAPYPLIDRVQAWEAAWRDFEGYSTRRLVIEATERLTGRPVLEPGEYSEVVNTALGHAVAAMDRVLEHWTPPQDQPVDPTGELDDESGDSGPDEDLPLADPGPGPADLSDDEPEYDGDTVDVGPVTVADAEQAGEIVDESGDAEGREASEGTSSPGTSPDSSTTIDPTLPLSEQVVAVLESSPDVKFTAPDVDLLLDRHDVKSTSTALSTASKRGRIVRLARGLYQANGQPEPDTGGLRDRITDHLRHGVASSTSIAEALDVPGVEVVNELRRMTEAGLVRIKGGGWTLLETRADVDARIAARRAAAAEAM